MLHVPEGGLFFSCKAQLWAQLPGGSTIGILCFCYFNFILAFIQSHWASLVMRLVLFSLHLEMGGLQIAPM